jgi:hypothetical protein
LQTAFSFLDAAIVHCPLKRAKLPPFQPCGNETFLEEFPQARTGLSKDNLETCFSPVNLYPTFYGLILFNRMTSAENEGQSALPAFP